ncbi:hypothetical protein BB559_003635 [Furculomyces boomerangus]|uniref:SET domain-containing protein n=2 Tax=Harpellales TaxID=61421 RepID=A0A2T9YK55_9FUNG|nr:hypothetical protein BB559_003635 [Furculomyces boomerangus]
MNTILQKYQSNDKYGALNINEKGITLLDGKYPSPLETLKYIHVDLERYDRYWHKEVDLELATLYSEIPSTYRIPLEDSKKLMSIIETYSIKFGENSNISEKGAIGMFPLSTLYFKQSCVPNCVYYGDNSGILYFRSTTKIKAGTTLTVSHINHYQTREARQKELYLKYQYWCSCLRCGEPMETSSDKLISGVGCVKCFKGVMYLPSKKKQKSLKITNSYLKKDISSFKNFSENLNLISEFKANEIRPGISIYEKSRTLAESLYKEDIHVNMFDDCNCAIIKDNSSGSGIFGNSIKSEKENQREIDNDTQECKYNHMEIPIKNLMVCDTCENIATKSSTESILKVCNQLLKNGIDAYRATDLNLAISKFSIIISCFEKQKIISKFNTIILEAYQLLEKCCNLKGDMIRAFYYQKEVVKLYENSGVLPRISLDMLAARIKLIESYILFTSTIKSKKLEFSNYLLKKYGNIVKENFEKAQTEIKIIFGEKSFLRKHLETLKLFANNNNRYLNNKENTEFKKESKSNENQNQKNDDSEKKVIIYKNNPFRDLFQKNVIQQNTKIKNLVFQPRKK